MVLSMVDATAACRVALLVMRFQAAVGDHKGSATTTRSSRGRIGRQARATSVLSIKPTIAWSSATALAGIVGSSSSLVEVYTILLVIVFVLVLTPLLVIRVISFPVLLALFTGILIFIVRSGTRG
jgi:hypothetical protein